ncbi:hypothetical protein AAFC00_004293 [Neodothiora populina]|uniref:PPM-type phosphatase domain-containing protein n=1 Tax=Neodothiora populina TaxID=2781224 RepID=A0ABR3PJ80_9PEZI
MLRPQYFQILRRQQRRLLSSATSRKSGDAVSPRLINSSILLLSAVASGLAWSKYRNVDEQSATDSKGALIEKALAESTSTDTGDKHRIYDDFKDAAKAAFESGLPGYRDQVSIEHFAQANARLKQSEQSNVRDGVRLDTCAVPSNSICEDTFAYTGMDDLPSGDKQDGRPYSFAIFDGHAGHATSHVLKSALNNTVLNSITEISLAEDELRPQTAQIEEAIKNAFLLTDAVIMASAEAAMDSSLLPSTSSMTIEHLAPALSGSCALLALFDPVLSNLNVACVGDSRAVLGRADASGKYTAMPLSVDQTGFNPAEVARVNAQHPGEENIFNEESGRLFGLAVSRAFGDARWKWSDERMLRAKNDSWGHGPRPNNVVKTPPYLTAEPEVTTTNINDDKTHPDFLIMASDGFWDHMSNDNAVLCVQKWIEAKKSGAIKQGSSTDSGLSDLGAEVKQGSSLDQGLYRNDDHDGDLEWKIKPEYFVAEDDNCATHLIRNVLGGSRRSLFSGLLTLAPPFSRDVRDDITIHVVFFGNI